MLIYRVSSAAFTSKKGRLIRSVPPLHSVQNFAALLLETSVAVTLTTVTPRNDRAGFHDLYLPRSSRSILSLASGACLSIFSGNPK